MNKTCLSCKDYWINDDYTSSCGMIITDPYEINPCGYYKRGGLKRWPHNKLGMYLQKRREIICTGMSSKKKKEELASFNTTVMCDCFFQDVMFHFGDTELLYKQIENLFGKEKADEVIEDLKTDAENTIGRTIDLGKGQLVWLKYLPKKERDYGILVHEIFHVVFLMTRKMGIEYSSEGEETYAYLTQYLTESVLQEYSKYR